MSGQRWVLRSSFGALAILAGGSSFAWGQNAPVPSGSGPGQAATVERPEVIVQNALRANPLTAPYPIAATWRNGVVVLSGRVGTKVIHDAAVQLAIAVGFPFRDDLVIDTAETFRVAMSSTPSMTGYAALTPNLSASYYVYPQPLFGRLDDPFFGMVPPLVSFPPWWRRQMEGPMPGPNGVGQPAPNPMPGPNGVGQPAPNPMPGPNGVGQPAPNPGVVPSVLVPRRPNNAPGGIGNPQIAPEGEGNPFNPPPAKGDVEITVNSRRSGLPPRRRRQRGDRARDRANGVERAGSHPGRDPVSGQAETRRHGRARHASPPAPAGHAGTGWRPAPGQAPTRRDARAGHAPLIPQPDAAPARASPHQTRLLNLLSRASHRPDPLRRRMAAWAPWTASD